MVSPVCSTRATASASRFRSRRRRLPGHLELKQGQSEAQGGEALAHLVVQLLGQVLPLRFFHLRQPGRQGPELFTLPDNLRLGPLAGRHILEHAVGLDEPALVVERDPPVKGDGDLGAVFTHHLKI